MIKISRAQTLKKLARSIFYAEIKRSLAFGYGEGPESEVEIMEAALDSYDVFDVSVCFGDCVIDGLVTDALNDHSLLIVDGNLEVNDLITSSHIIVTGDLTVNGALVCDSDGYALIVGGNLKVEELVIFDHILDVRGEVEANDCYERGTDIRLAEAAYDEDDDDEPRFYLTADLVREGYLIFD